MQFPVELALPCHIEEIHSIELATALQYSEQVLPKPLRSSHIPFFSLYEAIEEERLFVVLSKEKTVQGYVFLAIKEDAGHIAQIDLAPCYQRKGIRKALLKYILLWAKKLQLSSLWLTTFSNVPCNRPFYEENVFSVVEKNLHPFWIKEIIQHEETLHLKDRVAMQYYVK